MPESMTLPDLQVRLDQLSSGAALNLSRSEVERLFGLDDVAAARLRNFAAGHGCTFAWTGLGVCFSKQSKSQQTLPAP